MIEGAPEAVRVNRMEYLYIMRIYITKMTFVERINVPRTMILFEALNNEI